MNGIHHHRLRFWLAAFAGSLACWSASAADPLPLHVEHPFRSLAAWLREVSPDLRSAEAKTISRGITVLSNSQSYVKSFDGMAYELKGKLKDSSSTSDITKIKEEAALYESSSTAKKAKTLIKLLGQVEIALNSAEAAEIAAQWDAPTAHRYMKDAGLRLLPEQPPMGVLQATATNGSDNINGTAVSISGAGGVEETIVDDPGRGSDVQERGGQSGVSASGIEGRLGDKKKRRRRTKRSESNRERRTAKKRRPAASSRGQGGVGGGPLESFVVEVPGGCEVQCFVMVDDRDERLVIAVGDALTGEALLGCLAEEPAVVQLASHGLMRETGCVNRAAFQAACDILEWAGPHIKASLAPGGQFEGYPVHCAGHSFGGAVAACLAGMLDGAIDVEPSDSPGKRNGNDSDSDKNDPSPSASKGRKNAGSSSSWNGGSSAAGDVPSKRRRRNVDGGSSKRRDEAGRGDARSEKQKKEKKSSTLAKAPAGSGEDTAGKDPGEVRVDGAAPWVGVCRDRTTCVTFGCPPCLSGNLRVPFVTSFVLGDDMVPRTSHESLRRLKIRLLQVMPKRKGLLSQGVAFGSSLFTDVAGVAVQGVRQATTLAEDDARLAVPGRVWFAKPRRLKNGATLARVMQGNLKEDMLWQLHDIMLTKSMLSHHRLDKYIGILDRV